MAIVANVGGRTRSFESWDEVERAVGGRSTTTRTTREGDSGRSFADRNLPGESDAEREARERENRAGGGVSGSGFGGGGGLGTAAGGATPADAPGASGSRAGGGDRGGRQQAPAGFTARQMLDLGMSPQQIGQAFRDGRTTESNALSALGSLGHSGPIAQGFLRGTATTSTPTSQQRPNIPEDLRGDANKIFSDFRSGAIDQAAAINRLGNLLGDINLGREAFNSEFPGTGQGTGGIGTDAAGGAGGGPGTDVAGGPLTSLPGFGQAFEGFLRQEQQQQAVGPRGVFRQMTEPFTRGLSPIGREAVEDRFDPLLASFVTDPARINEIRFGRQPTLQEFIQNPGQLANPQEIIRRLVDIGGMVGSGDPAEQTRVEPFLDSGVTENLFTNAATRQLAPFFRGAGRNVLGREIERFQFDQPEDPLIAEIFRRRGRLF